MRDDLWCALRMIFSHRWFSAAIVGTLAVGVGLNMMIFTLVNAVLMKSMPIPGGKRLVAIRNVEVKYGKRDALAKVGGWVTPGKKRS